MLRRILLFSCLILCLAACQPATPRPTRLPPPTTTATDLPPTTIPTATNVPTPRPLDATVSIWHSWDEAQAAALDQVLRTFQAAYPQVRFVVTYVPAENLFERYRQAAYNGSGPTILLGQAAWGPDLAHQQLIADLTPAISDDIRQALTPPAQTLAVSQGKWINLPYAVSGVVLYRNPSILQNPSPDFETLKAASLAVTKGGIVGTDLERGLLYAGGHIYGLGGSLMDENCNPAFNNDDGLAWIALLRDFEQAGPVELNTNRDMRLFKESTAGMIVEGTWKRSELVQALGQPTVAIDPWPTLGNGALSGFVWAESAYLNIQAVGDEQAAALRLMKYLLNPDVQTLLAEVGFIPSVTNAQPRDRLVQEAVIALAGGVAYPTCPGTTAYTDALTAALYAIFEQNADPSAALQQAAADIERKLVEMRTSP
jgi:multiple sugar transport system substrate-binding protein